MPERPPPSRPPARSIPSIRGGVSAMWMLVAGLVIVIVFLLIQVFSIKHHADLAAQDAHVATIDREALQQELAIEKLLAERAAADSTNLAHVAVCVLLPPPGRATGDAGFIVVWSPPRGEGVILRSDEAPWPESAQLTLQARLRDATDTTTLATVVTGTVPADFTRGTFRFTAGVDRVLGFELSLSPGVGSSPVVHFSGPLVP